MRLASGLLKAYGELRQLVPLLESLAAALGSPKCPASASAVIQDPRFLEELRKVLPSFLFDAIMANIASRRALMPEDSAQIMLRRPENPRCHAGSAGSSARATGSRSALCGCCSKVCCPGMDRRACPVCPDPAAAGHSDRYWLVRFIPHTTSMSCMASPGRMPQCAVLLCSSVILHQGFKHQRVCTSSRTLHLDQSHSFLLSHGFLQPTQHTPCLAGVRVDVTTAAPVAAAAADLIRDSLAKPMVCSSSRLIVTAQSSPKIAEPALITYEPCRNSSSN